MDREGTPYIITKDVLGSSRVYRPAQPLTSPGPTPLEKVATISLLPTPDTGWAGRHGGQRVDHGCGVVQ